MSRVHGRSCVSPKERNHKKRKLTVSESLSVNNSLRASTAESRGQTPSGMKGLCTRVDSCPESLRYGHSEDVQNEDFTEKNKAAESKCDKFH